VSERVNERVGEQASSRITIASLSDVGMVRSKNEDYCGEFEQQGRELLVVADGMGGHKGGATASRVTVETIGEVFRTSVSEPDELLVDALAAANARVFNMSADAAELRGMGTTVVALLIGPDDRAWVAHVGDSRAYRVRGGQIEQLTEDHSVVAEMQRRGLLTREEAAVHPRRNEILRSVGVESAVRSDVVALDALLPGDTFVLCSDGLSGMVNDKEIADVVQSQPPHEAVKTLVNLANDLGGTDNVTIQVAAVNSERLPAPAPEAEAQDRPPTTATTPQLDVEVNIEVEETDRAGFAQIAGAAAIVSGLLLLAFVAYLMTRG
jgi:serine/threonine protein phosphatase PrpC